MQVVVGRASPRVVSRQSHTGPRRLTFLRSNNPFTSDDPTQPRNISTGIEPNHRVNVDDALDIGAEIQKRLTGKRFGDVTMKKKDIFHHCRRCLHLTGYSTLPVSMVHLTHGIFTKT